MPPVLLRVLALVVIASSLVACSRRRLPAPPAVPVSTVHDDDAVRRDSIARAEAALQDSIAREARSRSERDARLAAASSTLAAPIYFAYDRSDLSAESRQLLDSKVPLLQANPDLHLRLVGHTDERGSDEYNLALGQRRAASAKQYLTGHGIAGDRFVVASFGEERPVCDTSDESCWARNRRVEFEVTAGAVRAASR